MCLRAGTKRIEIESWSLVALSSVIFPVSMSIMFKGYLAAFCSLAQLALSDRPLGAAAADNVTLIDAAGCIIVSAAVFERSSHTTVRLHL